MSAAESWVPIAIGLVVQLVILAVAWGRMSALLEQLKPLMALIPTVAVHGEAIDGLKARVERLEDHPSWEQRP